MPGPSSSGIGSSVIRLARIPYLNTLPFFQQTEDPRLQAQTASPRVLGEWARAGKLDAGPFSLVDCWRMEDRFEYLGPFGISVLKATDSVLLFSKKPIEKLEGASIGVTSDTSTSVRLLRVLLNKRYGFSAKLVPLETESLEARLLIGDEALLAHYFKKWSSYSFVYDLAALWSQWQDLPFVFARWAVKKSLEPAQKDFLKGQLENSLKAFEKNRQVLAEQEAAKWKLPLDLILEYWKRFTYRLGEAENSSEERFRQMIQELEPDVA